MAELRRYGDEVDSVFDLLGSNENDLTAALAFVLARSPRFLDEFVKLVGGQKADSVVLRLETADADGRTDLEIDMGTSLVIVEAKKGYRLPTTNQLQTYAKRINMVGDGKLATLCGAPMAYVQAVLPSTIGGIPLEHVPWSKVLAAAKLARSSEKRGGRRWLDELTTYLRSAIYVTDPASSWAYCVSVSWDKPGGGGSRTLHDFVVKEGVYFHAYGAGGGWPIDPPNFMAFRWSGKVHQIRRVEEATVIPNLQDRWPDIPVTPDTDRPHAVYTLGPVIPMPEPLPSGTNYRAVRLWVLVDQMLTQPTLKEAHARSKALTNT